MPVVLVANKSDLSTHVITESEVERIAAELGLRFFVTSAVTGDKVAWAFNSLIIQILRPAIECLQD